MLQAWPGELPPLLGELAGLGSPSLYTAPQETQFDDGPSRSRRRTLFLETPRTIVLTLTPDQFARFLDFTRRELNQGARRFQANVLLPNGTIGFRTCKIEGSPAETAAGANHRISFTLKIWDW